MSKVLIGVNVLESVSSFVYASHIKFFTNLKLLHPDDQFVFFTPYRMSIDHMRNAAAKIAIDHKCDYLMFIDDDVVIKPNVYSVLKAADKDVIMALTYIRGYPFAPMFFKAFKQAKDSTGTLAEYLTTYDDYAEHVGPDGIVDCAAVGFSCVLIKMDLLKAVAPPWFITGPNHTEDVYFCNKARYTLDPAPTICCHTLVSTTHIMMPDGVNVENVEKLRELYKPDTPLGKSREERIQDSLRFLSENTPAPGEVLLEVISGD
jgi:hypothetical protein